MITPNVSDIAGIVNKIAPFGYAEEWDNVGLQVGDPGAAAGRIMVALDSGYAAVEAAVAAGCQVLLTHHPFLFKPLKKISLTDPLGRLLALALKNDLAVISLHTNYDSADEGLNDLLAGRLGVEGGVPLQVTGSEELVKLAVFVPQGHEESVLEALFRCSGVIGAYRDCSFRAPGIGTFTPLAGATPFLGTVGVREEVEESRVEVLLRREAMPAALKALRQAHPYEEPAYDLYPLLNRGPVHGLGRIGTLPAALPLGEFARQVKKRLGAAGLRLVGDPGSLVQKVAVCGGSGSSLLRTARQQGADLLVTGDVKYHEAREAEDLGIALLDAGHFATEVLMVQGFADRLERELAARRYAAQVIPCAVERDPFVFV
jgi:dinuclear metal center YbgI/SA1388 family protein